MLPERSSGIKRVVCSRNVKQVMTESDKRPEYHLSPSGVRFYPFSTILISPFNAIFSKLDFDPSLLSNSWPDTGRRLNLLDFQYVMEHSLFFFTKLSNCGNLGYFQQMKGYIQNICPSNLLIKVD